MKLLKYFLTGLLGASLLLSMGACTSDAGSGTESASESTAPVSTDAVSDAVKKPYTAGTFPKDATEVRYSDFGAVGDGVTECSGAIQAAMKSGKPHVVFGSGHYLVNGKVYIPKTVNITMDIKTGILIPL